MAYLTIAGWLITLALVLAGCAPSRTTPPSVTEPPVVVPTPTPAPTPEPAPVAPIPVPPAPTGPVLVITPNHLLTATPDPLEFGMAVLIKLVDPNGTVFYRIRLPDGSYPVNSGGEKGLLATSYGSDIGPLKPGTVFEVLDGGEWVPFVRYE